MARNNSPHGQKGQFKKEIEAYKSEVNQVTEGKPSSHPRSLLASVNYCQASGLTSYNSSIYKGLSGLTLL